MAEARTPALEGKRIIVTRAKRQSEPLMERLREKGALPVFAPMVEFAAPDNHAGTGGQSPRTAMSRD